MSYEEPHGVNVIKTKLFNRTFNLSRMMEDVSLRTKNRYRENRKKKIYLYKNPHARKSLMCNRKQHSEILLLLCCEQEPVKFLSKYHQVHSSFFPCN